MKTPRKTSLTIRHCPAEVHDALKKSAAANDRSVNDEALAWLENQARTQRVCTGAELAAVLRRWHKVFSRKEHLEIAKRIEEARQRMNGRVPGLRLAKF